jgi:hypothetical protein
MSLGIAETQVTSNPKSGFVLSAANQGWFIPAHHMPFTPSTIQNGVGPQIQSASAAANVVGAVQIVLPWTVVVRGASVYVVTGGGVGFMSSAIYSADGGTKLLDCGANAWDTHTASQARRFVSLTPFTLTPGVYWWATGSTDGAGSILGYGSFPTFLGVSLNQNVVRMGTAAGVMAAGVMPASLGVITPFGTLSGSSVPIVMFLC